MGEGSHREEKQSVPCSVFRFTVNCIIKEALQSECQVVKSFIDNRLHFLVTTIAFADRFPPEMRLFKQAVQSTSSQIPAVLSRKA